MTGSMTAIEIMRALYGDEGDHPYLPSPLQQARRLPGHILPRTSILRPAWAWNIGDASGIANALGIALKEDDGPPDDLIVQFKIVGVTFGDLRKAAPR